ncbi:unnamed protein product [Brachionus calyciflorus]|uniref:Small ribosomal subunit protein mS26 n=1 Tax=Brachionus calyciflorus TaxID=104777 RepID=A0A814KEF2_9BILA|nr:unnamed protein product [Brachionus calyciflorus]
MLKISNSTLTGLKTISQSIQQARSIRLRKPPWVPRAKNKQFRVPPLKPVNHEEYAYMKPIWDQYKSQMRSIYQLFKTEFKFSDKESIKAQEEKRKLEEKENRLLEENERVNSEILQNQLRDEVAKLEFKIKTAELDFKKQQKLDELYVRKADQLVSKLIEKSKTFIDPNNLEYEIEKALNERYDYNFSINSSGYFYKNKAQVNKAEAFNPKFFPKAKEIDENVAKLEGSETSQLSESQQPQTTL